MGGLVDQGLTGDPQRYRDRGATQIVQLADWNSP